MIKPSKEERSEQMKKIRDEVVDLKRSPLYEFRTSEGNVPVIGEGSHFAEIMFIGEAPGKNAKINLLKYEKAIPTK